MDAGFSDVPSASFEAGVTSMVEFGKELEKLREHFLLSYGGALNNFIYISYDQKLASNSAIAREFAFAHESILKAISEKSHNTAPIFAGVLHELCTEHQIERSMVESVNLNLVKHMMELAADAGRLQPEQTGSYGFVATLIAHDLWTALKLRQPGITAP